MPLYACMSVHEQQYHSNPSRCTWCCYLTHAYIRNKHAYIHIFIDTHARLHTFTYPTHVRIFHTGVSWTLLPVDQSVISSNSDFQFHAVTVLTQAVAYLSGSNGIIIKTGVMGQNIAQDWKWRVRWWCRVLIEGKREREKEKKKRREKNGFEKKRREWEKEEMIFESGEINDWHSAFPWN